MPQNAACVPLARFQMPKLANAVAAQLAPLQTSQAPRSAHSVGLAHMPWPIPPHVSHVHTVTSLKQVLGPALRVGQAPLQNVQQISAALVRRGPSQNVAHRNAQTARLESMQRRALQNARRVQLVLTLQLGQHHVPPALPVRTQTTVPGSAHSVQPAHTQQLELGSAPHVRLALGLAAKPYHAQRAQLAHSQLMQHSSVSLVQLAHSQAIRQLPAAHALHMHTPSTLGLQSVSHARHF